MRRNRCAATSKRRSPPKARLHVPARRAVRGRPDPEPERGFPEGSAAGQDQFVDRHLLRRRRPHPGARVGTPRRAAGRRAGRAQALPADRRRRELPCRGAGASVRQRPRGDRSGARDDPVGRLERRPQVGADFIARWLPGSEGWSAIRAGEPQAMFEAPASRSTTTRTTTARPAAWPSTRCAKRCAPAGEEHRPLHACCHNPRSRPDAGAVDALFDPGRGRAAAVPRPRVPGIRPGARRGRLRAARLAAARDRRGDRSPSSSPTRSPRHEPVRRALRRLSVV